MNRSVSRSVAALMVLAVMSAALAGLAAAGQSSAAASREPAIDRLSNQELMSEFDEVHASNPDRALLIAKRLWQKREGIPREDLLAGIADNNRPRVSRELMVDLLAGPPEEALATKDVRALLADGDLDEEIKGRIIAHFRFGKEDSALLTSIAAGTEEPAAFHALKKLGDVAPAEARRIALGAVKRAERPSDLKLSAAYKVLLRSDGARRDTAARRALLGHLTAVMADDASSAALRDSAAFALAEMRSLDALKVLLGAKKADRVLRVGAVDQNAAMLKSALEDDPDEAVIELAVTAMEIRPITDIAAPLRAVSGEVKSPELRRRVESVLKRIAADGTQMNPKWAEECATDE